MIQNIFLTSHFIVTKNFIYKSLKGNIITDYKGLPKVYKVIFFRNITLQLQSSLNNNYIVKPEIE